MGVEEIERLKEICRKNIAAIELLTAEIESSMIGTTKH